MRSVMFVFLFINYFQITQPNTRVLYHVTFFKLNENDKDSLYPDIEVSIDGYYKRIYY